MRCGQTCRGHQGVCAQRSFLFFAAHFSGLEIVPGVLEIKMIAQTVSACVRLLRPKTFVVLSKVEWGRFIKPIAPGDLRRGGKRLGEPSGRLL
jgi:3-hydroxymyristoyl/3-hydroxydecanoyl-(acyl carrier protein) dehydratase